MPRLVKIGVVVAIVAGAAGGALWLFGHDVDWKAKAREQASLLAAACKPRCKRSPIVETQDGRWRVRLNTAGGITQCFLLQPHERKERDETSGVSPCGRSGLRWWRDWKSVRSYRPDPEIASLAADAGMNNLGTKLFFTGHPHIVGSADLARSCKTRPKRDRTHDVYGCITPEGRIFIIRVSRRDLRGVMLVAAAHEMLHAAYRRLSPVERDKIDALTRGSLLAEYLPGYTQLQRELAAYPRQSRSSEAHSFLGSEYANLTSGLEEHYARYFDARTRVVRAYGQTKAIFRKFQMEATAIVVRIKRLTNQIRRLDADLNALGAKMETLKGGGDIAGYNALVPQYNELVDHQNELVKEQKTALDAWRRKLREGKLIEQSIGG